MKGKRDPVTNLKAHPYHSAGAMTIHTSQRMTRSRVIIDLSRTFQKAQDSIARDH